jgi:large subunit ribosomal protein L28
MGLFVCYHCGKGVQYGGTHTHHRGVAGGQWKKKAQNTRKVFKPNLHVVRLMVDGVSAKVKLCTKCLRTLRPASDRAAKYKKVTK